MGKTLEEMCCVWCVPIGEIEQDGIELPVVYDLSMVPTWALIAELERRQNEAFDGMESHGAKLEAAIAAESANRHLLDQQNGYKPLPFSAIASASKEKREQWEKEMVLSWLNVKKHTE